MNKEETIGDSNALFEKQLRITEVSSNLAPLSPIVTDAHCSTIGVHRWLSTPTLIQWAGLRALLCVGYAGTRHRISGKNWFRVLFSLFSFETPMSCFLVQCPVFRRNVPFCVISPWVAGGITGILISSNHCPSRSRAVDAAS